MGQSWKTIASQILTYLARIPAQVGGKLPVDATIGSSALPTGAATAANQVALQAISDLVDLGGAQRLPGNGASQALTVPTGALVMRVDAEGGAVRISHTGAASATTIPRVPEEAIDYIPLKSTDAPEFYGASASVIANINYYGARI
jgi:hypothetical protein